MQKYEISPDSKHLLYIFAKDESVNYFRFQDCLNIYISYSEYVMFVKFCIKNNLHVLHFNFDIYKNALYKEQVLKRLYLLDMSDVILFEVLLGYYNDKPCTNIRHIFDSDVSLFISMDECIGLFNEVDEICRQKSLDMLYKKLPNGFDIDKLFGNNKINFHYALALRALSFKTDIEEFNVGG